MPGGGIFRAFNASGRKTDTETTEGTPDHRERLNYSVCFSVCSVISVSSVVHLVMRFEMIGDSGSGPSL